MRLLAVVPALSGFLVAGLVRAELPNVRVVHEANEYLQLSDLSRDGLLWSQALDERGGIVGGSEIFLLRGTEKIRITDNEYTDNGARFVGDNIVWRGSVTPQGELFWYDGERARQFTMNERHELEFAVSNDRIAWSVGDGEDDEVFVFDGQEVIQLTDNDRFDAGVAVDGDWVSWLSFTRNGMELWLHQRGASEPRKLASSPHYMSAAALHGGRAVWAQVPADGEGASSGMHDIFLFDGAQTVRVTDTPDISESLPVLSNELVAWTVQVGKGSAELHVRDAGGSRMLSRECSGFRAAALDGDTVAWTEDVGPNNSEVFVHRRGVTLQLSNSEGWDSDPIVSGQRIAWTHSELGQSAYAVWLADWADENAEAGGGGGAAGAPTRGVAGAGVAGAGGVAGATGVAGAGGRAPSSEGMPLQSFGGEAGRADFELAGSAGSAPNEARTPRATASGCQCVIVPTGEPLPGGAGLGLIAAALGIAVARRQRAGHAGLKLPCPDRAS
jgi:hypothetical protein